MSQQCDGKHRWLPRTPWGGQAEAGWGVAGGVGQQFVPADRSSVPSTLSGSHPALHGHHHSMEELMAPGAGIYSCRELQDPSVPALLLEQIPVWLLAPSHGDRL